MQLEATNKILERLLVVNNDVVVTVTPYSYLPYLGFQKKTSKSRSGAAPS
jgi:hypothetical protein